MKPFFFLLCAVALCADASAQTFNDVRLSVLGGKSTTSWHGQADVQALNVELGKAISRHTSLGLVFSPTQLWQPRSWFGDQYGDGNETVRAFSASLMARHSFRVERSIQPYFELSIGPMYAEKRVPAATSRFNFVTQGGAGMTFNGQRRYPFFVAYRVMHISNGGYAPRNPGLNLSAIVAGVQLRSARPHSR